MTPFGGAISNYLHSWRLSNHPPGAVCSLLIWERWICTTNSFAWPSRPSLSRPQPNLSTLNLNYFLPHTLMSSQAEPLIISPHTLCTLSPMHLFLPLPRMAFVLSPHIQSSLLQCPASMPLPPGSPSLMPPPWGTIFSKSPWLSAVGSFAVRRSFAPIRPWTL